MDSKHKRLGKHYRSLDKRFEKLDRQVKALYDDAGDGRLFVSHDGPDEDELVSTCIY